MKECYTCFLLGWECADSTCANNAHTCKYIRLEGESCTLNNKCTYPKCEHGGNTDQLELFPNSNKE